MNSESEFDLVGAKEIIEHLQVSRRTLCRLVERTDVPVFRIGTLRASRRELDGWIRKNRANRAK